MTPTDKASSWRLLYPAIVLLATALFLYSLIPVLAPFITFLILLLLLSPYAGTREHRVLVLALGLLIVFWLLRTLGGLLAPFVLALVIAYILDPVVDRIQKRVRRRGLAVALLLVPLLAVVTVGAAFGIPALGDQATELIDNLPAAVEKFVAWLDATRLRLTRLPGLRGESFARVLESFSPERLAQMIQQRQAQLISAFWDGLLGVGKTFGVVLTVLGYFVLVPVLIIYLLIDFDSIVQRVLALIPVRERATWMPLLREYNELLSRYFRGQVVAALIVGLLTWLGLLIVGFPYSGLVGAVAGVFNLVPYLGLVVSALPALVIALLSGNVLVSLLKAGAVFAVVQLIDGTVTGPRIVGGSVGLHPVWVILALAVGSFFFGFVGLLLAMPAGVLIKLLLRETIKRYRASTIYEDGLRAPEV